MSKFLKTQKFFIIVPRKKLNILYVELITSYSICSQATPLFQGF